MLMNLNQLLTRLEDQQLRGLLFGIFKSQQQELIVHTKLVALRARWQSKAVKTIDDIDQSMSEVQRYFSAIHKRKFPNLRKNSAFAKNMKLFLARNVNITKVMQLFCEYIIALSQKDKQEQDRFLKVFPPENPAEMLCVGGTGSRIIGLIQQLKTSQGAQLLVVASDIGLRQGIDSMRHFISASAEVHALPYFNYVLGMEPKQTIVQRDSAFITPGSKIPVPVLWKFIRGYATNLRTKLELEILEDAKGRRVVAELIQAQTVTELFTDIELTKRVSAKLEQYKINIGALVQELDGDYTWNEAKILAFRKPPLLTLLENVQRNPIAKTQVEIDRIAIISNPKALYNKQAKEHIVSLLASDNLEAVFVGVEALWVLGAKMMANSPIQFMEIFQEAFLNGNRAMDAALEDVKNKLPKHQKYKIEGIKNYFVLYNAIPALATYNKSTTLTTCLYFNAPLEDIIMRLEALNGDEIKSSLEGLASNQLPDVEGCSQLMLRPDHLEIFAAIKERTRDLPADVLVRCLGIAALYNDMQTCSYLLDNFNIIPKALKYTPLLCLAASSDNIELVELFIAKGVNPNYTVHSTTAAHIAAQYVHGTTAAHIAAPHGNVAIIQALDAAGANLNQALEDGATPTHLAAEEGHAAVIAALHAAGVDLNQAKENGATPAHIAAEEGHAEVIAALHAAGANLNKACFERGTTPAYVAAQEGHAEVITALHAAGADLNQANENGTTPAHIAAYNGHAEVIAALHAAGADLNQAKENGATPAHMAAYAGHAEVIAALHAAGANLNKAYFDRGTTPAHFAAQEGHAEVIAALHAAGADLNQAMKNGDTPAHMAAYNGHAEVIAALHAAGADLNQANENGDTPAHMAAEDGHAEVIAALHAAGADLNKTHLYNGSTLAHIAAFKGHVDVIIALHAAGADLKKARGKDGLTPLRVARQNRHYAVAEIINEYNMEGRTRSACVIS
jgi:ankyrin repeat protein